MKQVTISIVTDSSTHERSEHPV